MTLNTIYFSNIPNDCHILKGRLASEGLDAFIYDEHMVWVDPFKAVAIGRVKQKVPVSQEEKALLIIEALHHNKLIDESGEYAMEEAAVSAEMARQDEVLALKARIRQDESLQERGEAIQSELLSPADIAD